MTQSVQMHASFDEVACVLAAQCALQATMPGIYVMGGLMRCDGSVVGRDYDGTPEVTMCLYAGSGDTWVNVFSRWNPPSPPPLPPAELGVFLAGMLVAELQKQEGAK